MFQRKILVKSLGTSESGNINFEDQNIKEKDEEKRKKINY